MTPCSGHYEARASLVCAAVDCARTTAKLTWFPHASLCADDAQRLGVLVALLLVRQRQPPTNAAVTAELGAAVVSLPSGLLAMIGEAISKLESRLEAGRGCTCGCSPDAEQCIRRSGNRRSEPRFDLGLAEARQSWLVLPAL